MADRTSADACRDKEAAIKEQEFEKAATFRLEERALATVERGEALRRRTYIVRAAGADGEGCTMRFIDARPGADMEPMKAVAVEGFRKFFEAEPVEVVVADFPYIDDDEESE